MPIPLQLIEDPELFIGLVAPIGVELEIVIKSLERSLNALKYHPKEFKVTDLMQDLQFPLPLSNASFVTSYRDKIAYANEARKRFGDDCLAALTITAIREYRAGQNESMHGAIGSEQDLHRPLRGQAYILSQFKRPEEINLLRRVYGRQFILISAFAPPEARKRAIVNKELHSTQSQITRTSAENLANDLVEQDSQESQDAHGQNVRDAFPLADVIIDASTQSVCEKQVDRFLSLLFGSNKISPTHDEYGMYLAKSAALRSTDLSRQVGAAIFSPDGEVLTVGSNEVPKFGGGTYWTDDIDDSRDSVKRYDPNDRRQLEIFVDILSRLLHGKHLSPDLLEINHPGRIAARLMEIEGDQAVKNAMIMDILEFGRIIHAEMSALSDAARKGIAVKNASLYCTTFPCHMCAKHIVASGIVKVTYLEPYSKSYANDLHSDSIVVDDNQEKRVSFRTFIGISPFRYRDLFERRRKRKDAQGAFKEWSDGEPRPNLDIYDPSYAAAESRVAAGFATAIQSQPSPVGHTPVRTEKSSE